MMPGPGHAICVSAAHHSHHAPGCDGTTAAHAPLDGTGPRCHYDSGVVVGRVTEAELSLSISGQLHAELGRRGVSSILLDLPLASTIREIGALRPLAAIEIHCDSGAGDSSKVLHAIGASARSLDLAEVITVALRLAMPWPCRGIFPGCPPETPHQSLGFLERTPCSAVVVELGFLDRESHRLILTSPAGQQAVAHELAGAIVAWADGQCPLCGVTGRLADRPCSCTIGFGEGSGSSIRA